MGSDSERQGLGFGSDSETQAKDRPEIAGEIPAGSGRRARAVAQGLGQWLRGLICPTLVFHVSLS